MPNGSLRRRHRGRHQPVGHLVKLRQHLIVPTLERAAACSGSAVLLDQSSSSSNPNSRKLPSLTNEPIEASVV